MNVKQFKEKITKYLEGLNDNIEIQIVDQESDFPNGITPLYPAKRRTYYPSSTPLPGYNEWSEWKDDPIPRDANFKSSRLEIELTSDIPVRYILCIH